MRLDQLLVERGLALNRTRAHASIMAGEIVSEGHRLTKPGHLVPKDIDLAVNSRHARFVSRGGDKLEGALADFHVTVDGFKCLDLGSSTGGFTDCLLQHGAAAIVGVDVGKGQLHQNLRNDPRVTVLEGVNARYLRAQDFPGPFDLVVADVSFISLTKIIPVVPLFLKVRSGRFLALIKPQFEVGPAAIGKGGIVRDPKAQEGAVKNVTACLKDNGLVKLGVERSHLTGADGNVEFFVFAKREA
ncbi:MAG: TlyA family RNA methyltransferase [Candidatus Firestonebacteria bacterium]|nr:TlyA family RNA methyltransferase [Candidatus Firestonebacteria bacterium]